jgi:hypothetical protein
VRKSESEWRTYRTRFLVRAKQLTAPLDFLDALGREHRGQAGDYLIVSSDGTRRIASREIFEDIYIAIDSRRAAGRKVRPQMNLRKAASPNRAATL